MKSVIDYILTKNLRNVLIVTNSTREAHHIFLVLKAKCMSHANEFERVKFPIIESQTRSRVMIVSGTEWNAENTIRGYYIDRLLYTPGADISASIKFKEYTTYSLHKRGGKTGEFIWDQNQVYFPHQ